MDYKLDDRPLTQPSRGNREREKTGFERTIESCELFYIAKDIGRSINEWKELEPYD